jgi:S1-C subfamily serine protease/ATP-dependent Clp protease adapter protein ClpS
MLEHWQLIVTAVVAAISVWVEPFLSRRSHGVAAFVPSSNHKIHHAYRQSSTFPSLIEATKTPPQTQLYQSASDVAQTALPSVALILPLGVRNITARGSGFVIDFPTDAFANETQSARGIIYLLTAAHVAMPGYRIQVVFKSGEEDEDGVDASISMPANVIGRDVSCDLALLRVNIDSAPNMGFIPPSPLLISDTKAAIGTKAFAMGYPSGGVVGPAMTSGVVCGNALGLVTANSIIDDRRNETQSNSSSDGSSSSDKTTNYVVTDAAMAGGMSGGPLVDGTTGKVLGINALINFELRALGNYAVSASECINFLKEQSLRMNDSTGQPENDGQQTTYRVMLYNDRFNKRARVQDLLQNVAKLNETESNRIMMEAHTGGRGVVREFLGDDVEAKELCGALRKEDLLVEVERMC